MTSTDEQVPEELEATVRALRDHAEQLPTAGRADLHAAIESGRRQVRRRRTLTLAAGLAAAVVVGLGVTGDLGAPRQEGAPARPVPDATVTVEDGKRPVTEIYSAAEQVLASAGLEVDGRIAWDVGETSLYGVGPSYLTGQPTPVAAPSGFPDEGYPSEFAHGRVRLAGGSTLFVRTDRVDGGLPLEQDYCVWFLTLPTPAPSDCEQSRTADGGGLLLRQEEYERLTYVWAGGQVMVKRDSVPRFGDSTGDEPNWEAMERIVTDPRLRW